VLEALCVYPWPGNVRELRNVIERCLALGQSPEKCLRGGPSGEAPPPAGEDTQALSLEVVEKRHILKVLDMNDGNKSAAARQLGVSRKTLERKVQAWQSDDRISSQ
jgi:DNA-binding NtrC family response regulator